MSFLEDKALEIAGRKSDGSIEVAVDPVTIAAIISLIVEVFQLFKNCQKKPGEVKAVISSPSWLQRWWLRGRIRQELRSQGSNKNANEVLDNMLSQAQSMSHTEVATLYEEANLYLAIANV